jgi:hypothetical protein
MKNVELAAAELVLKGPPAAQRAFKAFLAEPKKQEAAVRPMRKGERRQPRPPSLAAEKLAASL